MRLGIDFGTTRTVIAFADRGNYPVLDFVDHDGDTSSFIPSMVAARAGEIRYGFDALAVASDATFTVLRSFKRVLSDPALGGGHRVLVGDTAIALGDLLTGFFEHVREHISKRLKRSRKASPDLAFHAAVAVPANALGSQRLTTLDAFRRAGFDITAMLNEPSAAGFEYTHRHRSTLSARRDLVVVYDLGGGTFDASAVRMTGARHEVLATAGIGRLGGDDFDAVLARLALLQVDLDLDALPLRSARALLGQCRDVKERLHANSRKIVIDLESALGAMAPQADVVLATSDYYLACAPLVERTIDAMLPVMTRFEEEARVPDLADVAGVYVVGGASELPIVARTLRERFGRRVHRSPHPSAAVAIGLAIAADGATDFSLVDRYARTFGVFREAHGGTEITVDPIFVPDTELPTRAGGPLLRTRSYRAAHNIGHYRFFECGAVDALGKPQGDMTLFGEVRFAFDDAHSVDVAVERRSDGPYIEERYSLDERGIVEVIIRNLDSGYEQAYRLGA